MPRKNKKPAPFMFYALEYKAKQKRNMSQEQAISEAGEIWKVIIQLELCKDYF